MESQTEKTHRLKVIRTNDTVVNITYPVTCDLIVTQNENGKPLQVSLEEKKISSWEGLRHKRMAHF